MRYFLITFSFINTIFYILIYAYYDNILSLFDITGASTIALAYAKLFVLVIIGFCIGINVMLMLKLKLEKSFFSYKSLILIGIIPFFCLILSQGSITSFIISRFFDSNKTLSELAFYLFSRQTVWSLWLGFAIGSSIRFGFSKRKHRHLNQDQAKQEDSVLIKAIDT